MAQTLRTWRRRGTYAVGGTAGSRTAKEALTALRNFMATSPSPDWKWEVTTDGLNNLSGGQEAPYLELTPVSNIGDHPMSVLILGLGGSATVDTDLVYNDGNARYAYGLNQEAANLYIAFAPQGRSASLVDPFGASSPYGSDPWSLYYRLNLTSDIDEWLVYEHEDALVLGMRMNGSNYRGVAIGDLITHYSTDVARSDGRGPAMFSFGGSARDVGEHWWLGRQVSNYAACLGFNMSSAGTDEYYNPFATFWNAANGAFGLFANTAAIPQVQWSSSSNPTTGGVGFNTDYNGRVIPQRIRLVTSYPTSSSPPFLVGYLRQIQYYGVGVLDSTILNGDDSVAGYIGSARGDGNLGDALFLSNFV